MSAPRLAFGCANVGIAWSSDEELGALAKTLKEVGIDTLDTAARYPPTSPGLAENLLGKLSGEGFNIDTKISVKAWDGNGSMAEATVAQSVASSLKALKTSRASLLYPNRAIHCY
jgi:aflatoxin B1 aldehyde reductase